MSRAPGIVLSASRRRSRDTRSVRSRISGKVNFAQAVGSSGWKRRDTASIVWRALAASGSISVNQNGSVLLAMASTSDHASRSPAVHASDGSASSPSATRACVLARRRTSRNSGHATRPSVPATIAQIRTWPVCQSHTPPNTSSASQGSATASTSSVSAQWRRSASPNLMRAAPVCAREPWLAAIPPPDPPQTHAAPPPWEH